MQRVRKTLCVFVVLATAVSTLLANTPLLLVCACSARTTKRTSQVGETEPEACRCGGDCCAVQSEKCPCCCQTKSSARAAQPDRDKSAKGPAFQAAHCLKTVFASEQVLLSERHSVSAGEPFAQVVHSFTSMHETVPAVPGLSPMEWEIHGLPPPTDLVVVLQHFVI
jgi:hypothetical protein